jgi:hypothetical protein
MDDINGKCLARVANQLDTIAKKAKVSTLYDFYSMTREQAIAELLGGDPDDPSTFDESAVPAEAWYDPQVALQTVRALLEFVRKDGDAIEDVGCVREDLEAFERHLVTAAERNVRWHLVIDA